MDYFFFKYIYLSKMGVYKQIIIVKENYVK